MYTCKLKIKKSSVNAWRSLCWWPDLSDCLITSSISQGQPQKKPADYNYWDDGEARREDLGWQSEDVVWRRHWRQTGRGTLTGRPWMARHDEKTSKTRSMYYYRNETMLGWLSRRRCFTSVSLTSRTFLTATCSWPSRPRNTAPCEPLPSQVRSEMFSNGISQSSSSNKCTSTGFPSHRLWTNKTTHLYRTFKLSSKTANI